MTSTLVANPCEQRTLRFRSRLSPPECARRLEDAAFPLNASLSTFGFHLGRTIDDGTISFGLERFRWFTSWLWKPYFSGTLQSDPATRGTTVVGSFGFRPGARGTAVFFAVLALSATAVSLLLGEWRLLAIPIIT